MKTLLAICLVFLAAVGCGALPDRIFEDMHEGISKYCSELTVTERMAINRALNRELAPHSMHIHCDGDTQEETANAYQFKCDGESQTGAMRYVCTKYAHACGAAPVYCDWLGIGPDAYGESSYPEPITEPSPTGTDELYPTMKRPL